MSHRKAAEIFGWYGMAAILAAYALVSFRIISAASFAYQILNLTGALGLGYICFVKKVYQNVILNAVWAIVAIAALVIILL